jgi:hypothetical protein
MSLPPPESLVLVAVLPEPRDLEIARLLGWYRIPLRRAPKVLAVDYLAFYQTASFGEQGQQIKWLAPVRGNELTTRGELLQDEPHHPRAREEYFKVSLGALTPLAQPIPAGGWKRITFFYTTGEYLAQAQSVNDLLVASEDRKLLWRALRERAVHADQYRLDDLPELPLEPELLALLGLLQGLKETGEEYD